VLWVSVSLDGYMEGPDRQPEWHAVVEEVHAFSDQHLENSGVFLGGRITDELMAAFWPTADEDPTNPAPVREVARIWRDMPTSVCSRMVASVEWGTTIVREVVPEQVEALKTQPVGLLLLGGEEVGTVLLATTSPTSSGSSSTRSSSGGVGRSPTPPTTLDRSPSSRPGASRTPSSSSAIGGTDRPPGPCWASRARRRSRPTPGLGRRHANA
jgi:dihydrofolate reductase